jgi:hypothetical protein
MRPILLQAGSHSDQCNSSLNDFEKYQAKELRRKSLKEIRSHGTLPLNHGKQQRQKVLKALLER